jgi:hypothetical protein
MEGAVTGEAKGARLRTRPLRLRMAAQGAQGRKGHYGARRVFFC